MYGKRMCELRQQQGLSQKEIPLQENQGQRGMAGQ